jgi:sugar lactone lactonase YvrE
MTNDIFSLSKERDRVVDLPVESTTNLSFGGANLDATYVTWISWTVKGGVPRERGAGASSSSRGLAYAVCRSRPSLVETTY